MTKLTFAELEVVMRIDYYRDVVARAHDKRMQLPSCEARVEALLSDFMPIEDYTHSWFIHDAITPICHGWPREPVRVPTHHIEVRKCWTDIVCTEWEPLPEVESCTAGALHDYLKKLYGKDPDLQPVGYGLRVVEDINGYQYKFVSMPPLKIPNREDVQRFMTEILASQA